LSEDRPRLDGIPPQQRVPTPAETIAPGRPHARAGP
jgi:hypothetical protein